MAAKTINVGLVGYKFMGKAHSNAYLKVDKFFDLDAQPVMKAICGREKEGLAAFAEKFGWESYETSWEKLVARKWRISPIAPSLINCLASATAGHLR